MTLAGVTIQRAGIEGHWPLVTSFWSLGRQQWRDGSQDHVSVGGQRGRWQQFVIIGRIFIGPANIWNILN